MRALHLWSGGIESTSFLKWQLENTDDELYVHRVVFHNPENRNDMETKAINALMPKLQAIRSFHYDTSEISICNGKALPIDREYYMAFGATALMYHYCSELRRGYCAEDQWSRRWEVKNGVKTFHYEKGISLEDNYLWKAEPALLFLPELDDLKRIIKIHPTHYWTKARHVSYLGDLLKYTWSCRTPVGENECGVCHSCKEKHAAMRGTSNIPEIARRMK